MPIPIHLDLDSQGRVIPRDDPPRTLNNRTKVPPGESVTFHIPGGSQGGSISFVTSPFGSSPKDKQFDYASPDPHVIPLSVPNGSLFPYSCVIVDSNGNQHTTGGGEIEVGL
jgi:hypothetical protein